MGKLEKKNKTVTAVVEKKVLTPTVVPNSDDILQRVKKDLDASDLGDFCRLRASIGLVTYRDMNAYGDWESRLVQMFPNRSTRTLRRHMQEARRFLSAVGVKPQDAFNMMLEMNEDDVRKFVAAQADGKKALPEKGVAKQIALANKFTNAVVSYSSGEKPEVEPPKPKRLTKEEEDSARRDFALSVSRRVREWSEDRKTIRTLETDTLETILSELTLSVQVIKGEIREREANGVK